MDIPPQGESLRLDEATLRHDASGFHLVEDDGVTRVFEPLGGDSDRYFLVRIADGYGNAIKLERDPDGTLRRIVDAVGREVVIEHAPSGQISCFAVRLPNGTLHRFMRYEFDANGDLVMSIDASGNITHFGYEEHRLVKETSAGGRTTHYQYVDGRCVETWVERSDPADKSLDATASDKLADGTRAKGILHVRVTREGDYVEVANSRDVKRYFMNERGTFDKAVFGGGVHTNRYDDWGRLVAYADSRGGEWKWERDARGNVLRESNPLKETLAYAYDEWGRLVAITDPLGRTTVYETNMPKGDVFAHGAGRRRPAHRVPER